MIVRKGKMRPGLDRSSIGGNKGEFGGRRELELLISLSQGLMGKNVS